MEEFFYPNEKRHMISKVLWKIKVQKWPNTHLGTWFSSPDTGARKRKWDKREEHRVTVEQRDGKKEPQRQCQHRLRQVLEDELPALVLLCALQPPLEVHFSASALSHGWKNEIKWAWYPCSPLRSAFIASLTDWLSVFRRNWFNWIVCVWWAPALSGWL